MASNGDNVNPLPHLLRRVAASFNKAVQRTGGSRFAQRRTQRHRRLASVADLCLMLQRTRDEIMNTKQKTLTYIAVAAIGLTSLFAAWDLTGSPNHSNVTRYAPIFAPPNLGPYAKRELASSVFWSWLVVGGMYSLMFVAFREPAAQTRR